MVDPIEDVQFTLLTPDPVEQRPCDTDRFHFPVDAAVTLRTDTVRTPYLVDVFVRDGEGELIVEGLDGTESLPAGEYTIDISSVGMKLYLAIEGPARLVPGSDELRLTVDGGDIRVGLRSIHERPAATVTTTDDPRDLMAAVSSLGSALKTTSPERSFPTLRGHPPLIEHGTELSVPNAAAAPSTGIRIEIPSDLRYVYPVAPLAYYLGATVEPGPVPAVVADGERTTLTGDDGFESTVARTLKRLFLLDCVVRTEGLYGVDLHERAVVADAVDLDCRALYDAPIDERTRRYLDVDHGAVADAIPEWKVTADVRPRPADAEALPFLANELAVVRTPDATGSRERSGNLADDVEAFFGADAGTVTRRGDASRSSGGVAASTDRSVVRPAPADSIEQVYVGDGVPYGASKMTAAAYRRRFGHDPSAEPRISVAVVCNDATLADENVVSEIYGSRNRIDFDVSTHHELSTADLREVLRADTDFLHYIGHVDDGGIECRDGYLDAETVDSVGVSTVFLNACDAYEQGRALVDGGALGVIATLTDVLNTAASAVGETVARLLNQGFSLGATLSMVSDYESVGHHYVVVGDGSVSLVNNESGTPYHAAVSTTGDDEYEITLVGRPTTVAPLGSLYRPFLDGAETKYLNSGPMGTFAVTGEELAEFLSRQEIPVVFDGSLHWSSTFEVP